MPEPLELNSNFNTQFSRAQVFLPQSVRGFLVLLKIMVEEFLHWCTRPIEVFFRYKFGTRGHSVFQVVQLGLTALYLLTLVSIDPLLVTFGLVSAGLSIYHLIEAHRWEKYGSPPRYSWSHGGPMPWWAWVARRLKLLGVDVRRGPLAAFIWRFAEPLVCLVLAIALYPFSKALSIYLGCCTVAVFWKGLIVRQRIVTMRRDQVDALIISQQLIGVQRAAAGQGDRRTYLVRLPDPVLRQSGDGETPAPPPTPEQAPAAPNATDEEYIRLQCGKCRRRFQVHRKHQGRRGKCKKCGNPVPVV